LALEYKRFFIRPFEREVGKWRAKIRRSDGKPIVVGHKRLQWFETGLDAGTPDAAMLMALNAIDSGMFSSSDVRDRQRVRALLPSRLKVTASTLVPEGQPEGSPPENLIRPD
jgi:hypothetical protein